MPRRLPHLALLLLLVAGALRTLAEALPDAPTSQLPAQTASASVPTTAAASITGTVTDQDKASIAGAHITLTQPDHPQDDAVTTSDGSFTFTNLPPGPFKLSIAAAGFSLTQTSGELQPGEARELPAIVLAAASVADVSVTATQADIAEAQINLQEKQRILGVFPNFYVSYISDPVPLDPKQKFELALRTMVDPISFVLNGVTAGLQQADNLYDWGQGAQGFAKRYAASYGTFLTGDLIGNAALPILFKQDPRYFFKSNGSVRSRILYAFAMAVVCKGDNHRWQPDYSGILGGIAAAGISNAYYPAANRSGARLIFEGTAIGVGVAGIQNVIQEFLIRKITPHTHPTTPSDP